MTMEWQPIETAPKDGTKIWAWLYDRGICAMQWVTAEQIAESEGSDNPGMYDPYWALSTSIDDAYNPSWWLPLDAIPLPAGIIWIKDDWSERAAAGEGRWRDEAQR